MTTIGAGRTRPVEGGSRNQRGFSINLPRLVWTHQPWYKGWHPPTDEKTGSVETTVRAIEAIDQRHYAR